MQRPLLGEPLPIDLLNTRWIAAGHRHDLLDDPVEAAGWLTSWGLPSTPGDARAVIDRLKRARDAIAAHIAAPGEGASAGAVNDLLAAGHLRLRLGPNGPVREAVVQDPAWLPAWTALHAYLELVDEQGGRVRKCANPECVLHFVDATARNARRWCSMEACGNRAKARRHYTRKTTAARGESR
ncbi:CGNR zinc finger domain-containing protein [Cryptosporangium minutisporangium]|uniref:CGNR zinc finger domain-containing protein n=1 Tax=Cryptosporangium minutisporangium TaxID=113569 RepID=A0ABP6SSR0_9ACTN